MKKYLILSFSTLFLTYISFAQIQDPVKFKIDLKKSSMQNGKLIFTGIAAKGWHVYSTGIASGGPSPASVTFDTLAGAVIMGELTPGPGETEEYDYVFKMKLRFFDSKATFTQQLNIIDSENYIIKGHLTYAACNNENCLPPTDVPFQFYGKQSGKSIAETTHKDTGWSEMGKYWNPVVEQLHAMNKNASVETHSWLYIFFMGFLGGLLAMLTPCVWPVIPMTVSFFLKRNSTREKGVAEAIIYGASIIVIYLSLGLAITLVFGASALNALSTNAIFNILFFLLLILFALSFFGLFELTLPARWSTAVDNKAGKTRGILSIFLMAFTLTLVSFSCTGPIIGFLLVEVSTAGNILGPAIGMFGFAMALSLPFTLFALFPSWLNSVPKSGGWMNKIKVVLGFVELAFAFKFLSVADMAYGWGVLSRELFIVIWIIISILAGLYLLGIIKMNEDIKGARVSNLRKIFAIIPFAFAGYMVPGIWGAPCRMVSAFTPPMYTQTWNIYNNEVHAQFDDYDKGMEYALCVGKPVMLDFTGYGCVNCRKMEASVWTDKEISKLINNEYVLIALFVDNKRPLDKEIVIVENGRERRLRTFGDKWSYLQRVKFGANAQPFYVLVDNKGYPLTGSRAYDQDVKAYKSFLEEGLKNFRKK